MIRQVIARQDPALTAHVVSSRLLRYTAGADPAIDLPAYVRAGSSLVQFGRCLVVVQDDASFIAVVDPHTWQVRAVPLPTGEGAPRQFDDLRGNKRFKLDLEACVGIPGGAVDLLLAFGSGSSPLRERVATVRDPVGATPEVAVTETPELYAVLRAAQDFAGSDMNIEGAVLVGDRIRLVGRGNGLARDGLLPLDASCDLDWAALWAYIQNPRTKPPPQPQTIVQYQLGELDGLRLGFTDAASGPGTVIFSAAAEDSLDATRDGPVAGSALGIFDTPERVRWTVLRDSDGNQFTGKVEGVTLAPETPYRAYVVVDRDDPRRPSELCEVDLGGPWYRS